MKKKLVIVESPSKAKTIGRMLGKEYHIEASMGHVRDLPKSRLGVDVENQFAPKYVVPKEKKKVVDALRQAADGASEIYLATDPDREGEAISWHLVEAAKLHELPLHRVVFHEITMEAVQKAFHHPRPIDMRLVDSQQARRILDRLMGYKLSPLLWAKVMKGLSAGRVQSVALRMVVEREREILGFVPKEYWSIEAELSRVSPPPTPSFRASLAGMVGKTKKLVLGKKGEADKVLAELKGASYSVKGVVKKESQRQPAAPFITSTLQQEAWRKLHFTGERTMSLAQQLYEGLPVGEEGVVGLITYMRTDSTRVASSAIDETRDFIQGKYGPEFLPPQPRFFTRKVKGAQEAHEAIRPTAVHREPSQLKPFLSRDQLRLYELIWKRMVASQMAAAVFDSITVEIAARPEGKEIDYLLRASRMALRFPGFTALYMEGKDEPGPEEAEGGKLPLPELSQGQLLKLLGLFPDQHFTQPPARYTEATLVKALEENGIGRPSTYAPIISTVQDRGYVLKVDGHFQPQELGFTVSDLLTTNFQDIVDVGFTARMEGELDDVAQGRRKWVSVVQDFYSPFNEILGKAFQDIEKVKMPEEPSDETCPECGKPMVVKRGRFGKFLACKGYPECKGTKPFLSRIGVRCPECGKDLVERMNRRKQVFYGCSGYPECRFTTGRRPVSHPCPHCRGLLTLYGKRGARCLACHKYTKLPDMPAEEGKVGQEVAEMAE